jgi:hypothetical protein
MGTTRWVPIIALILFLLGSTSLKSSAFHTGSIVVGRLNNGAMTLVSSMTVTTKSDKSITRDSTDVPVPTIPILRWIRNKRKIRSQRQQRRVNNHHEEQQHQRATQNSVPHAGRHFFPSHLAYRRPLLRRMFQKIRRRKRFMEGWYYRLTLKDYEIYDDNNNNNNNNDNRGNGTTTKLPALSFAFIISIEDAGIQSSDLRLACLQAIGPNDQYLVQATKDDTAFWASKQTQSLGCTFEKYDDYESSNDFETIITHLDPNVWKESVRSGFQIIDDTDSDDASSSSPQRQPRWMGRINGHDGSKGGVLDGQGIQGSLEFDFSIDPDSVCGYGGYTTSRNTSAITKITVNDNSNDVATGTNRTSTQNRQRNQYAKEQKSTGGKRETSA